MSDKYFLDTNILVYTFDNSSKRKKLVANQLVEKALVDQCGIISSQVVQEFLNVATKKFAVPMSISETEDYLKLVLEKLCEVFPSFDLYKEALLIATSHRYSFYDSLIISAALQSGCNKLYTEDLQDGQRVGNVQIINPFRDIKYE